MKVAQAPKRPFAMAAVLIVTILATAAPGPRAEAADLGPLLAGRVFVEGYDPAVQAADVFFGKYGDVEPAVVFETRTADGGFGPVLKLTRPAGGWVEGTFANLAVLTGAAQSCQFDSSSLVLTGVSLDAGQPTLLTGGFEIRCHQAPSLSGSFVFPSTAPLRALDVDPPAPPLVGYHHPVTGVMAAHNRGDVPVTMGTAALVDTVEGISITADTCSGQTVPPDGTCSVSVRFDPEVAPDGASTRLAVPNDAPSGDGVASAPVNVTVDPRGYGDIHPVEPARIVDSTIGLGRPGNATGPIGASAPAVVHLAGQGGVPADGVLGALLVVTAKNSKQPGSLTVKAADAAATTATSMSYVAKKPVSSTVLTRVSAGGEISIAVSTATDVTVDVVAWVSDDRVPSGGLHVVESGRGFGQGLDPEVTLRLGTGVGGFSIKRFSNPHHRFLAAVRISGATSDAELRFWHPDDPEPAVGNIAVEARVTKTALVLMRSDRYFDVLTHLTKGRATVSITPVASLEPNPYSWSGRMLFLDTPSTVFDTALGSPLLAKADRTLPVVTPVFDQGSPVILGALTTTSSRAAGGVSMSVPGSGPPIIPSVEAKTGRAMSGLAMAPMSNTSVTVSNLTTRTTNARYDAVAVLATTDPEPGALASPAAAGTRETSGPVTSTQVAAETVMVDRAGGATPVGGPAPVSGLARAAVAPNAEITFSTSDHGHVGPGWIDYLVEQPFSTTLPATLTGDGTRTLTFSAAGQFPFQLYTGNDHKLQPGHYTGAFASTDGGMGACNADALKGRLDIDTAEYSGDTLTQLTGRAVVICPITGRLHISFAFPADVARPVLAIDGMYGDLRKMPYFSGGSRPIVLRNVGTAGLDVGQLVLTNDRMAIDDDGCSNTSVAPAGECTVEISFLPDDLVQDPLDGSTLLIPTNQNVSEVPYSYPLVGSGALGDAGLVHLVDRTTVFDSLTGVGRTGSATTPLAPGPAEVVDVAGALGIDPDAAWGALVTLTATGTTATGAITLTEAGVAPGAGTTLSFATGDKITSSSVVSLSEDGRIAVTTSAEVHLQVQVIAYIGSDLLPATGGVVDLRDPDRVIDSKKGINIAKRKLAPGAVTASTGGWHPGIYAITVAAPSAATELKVWHAQQTEADATSIFVPKGVTRTSTVFLPGSGNLVFRSSTAVHITVDGQGTIGDMPPVLYEWPGRILVNRRPLRGIDTRSFGKAGAIGSRSLHAWEFSYLEDDGIGVQGMLTNVTTRETTSAGTLSMFSIDNTFLPNGQTASSRSKVDASTFAAITTGSRVAFWVYSASGKTHYTIDWVAIVTDFPRPWDPDGPLMSPPVASAFLAMHRVGRLAVPTGFEPVPPP